MKRLPAPRMSVPSVRASASLMREADTAVAQLRTYRDSMRMISPPWLQHGTAEKVLYAIALHVDAFADALVAAVKQRFPGYYSFESLSMLGRERRIPRGRYESDDNYAARLTRFLLDHPYRGGPYAMLNQWHIFWRPHNVPVDLVYANGVRFAMDAAGVITREIIDWRPDGNAAKWARWWLFVYSDRWAEIAPTPTELAALKLIPRQWNAAHPNGTIILFPTGAELWNWPLGRVWNEDGVWNTSGTVRFIDTEANV